MPSSVRSRVGLVSGVDRRQAVRRSLELVAADIAPRIKDQLLIKPNFLSSTNPLASSHVDAVRGILDFVLTLPTPPQSIIVAEGGNEAYSGEAFDRLHFRALVDESPIPIRLVDLHQETAWVETLIVLADRSETTVRMPKLVLDCPSTLSLAVAKTHDVCVVTLALKNMIMGTIHKADRVKMHGYRSHAERRLPTEAQVLNINLMRLARFLTPDISVVDGIQGVQGNGPGGSDAVDFRLVAAGVDVYATDAVMTQAMGFDPLSMALLHYGHELGLGVADLANIHVLGTDLADVAVPFKPHDTTHEQLQWHADAPLLAYLNA